MTDLELIIFDMDGLMFDTERISFSCWRQAALRYGYALDEQFYTKVIGSNVVRGKEMFLAHFGQDFPHGIIRSETLEIIGRALQANGVPVKEGLYELLDYIEQLNLKKAVATSTSRDRTVELLKMAGINNRFDYILCGDEIENSKPHPEIFLKVAMNLGCLPEKCLVLEDSEAGILAAHSAGMISVMIADMKEPDDDIKILPLKQMKSLTEVKLFLKAEERRRFCITECERIP